MKAFISILNFGSNILRYITQGLEGMTLSLNKHTSGGIDVLVDVEEVVDGSACPPAVDVVTLSTRSGIESSSLSVSAQK